MMDFERLYNDYLDEVDRLEESDLTIRSKYLQLKQVLERSCKEITGSESLQFPSLFSRLVFISQKYDLPNSLEWNLQNVRVKSTYLLKNEKNLVTEKQLTQAQKTLEAFYLHLSGDKAEEISIEPDDKQVGELDTSKIRVQVLENLQDQKILVCYVDNLIDSHVRVRYGLDKYNKPFNGTIARIWAGAQLNLIDVKIDAEGYYIPKAFILEPDYLIDASAIAECFQDFAKSHLQYFRRKFEQPVSTHYLLMGNLANFFLDELIYADDIDALQFEDVFMASFAQMPFEYSACEDIAEPHAFREFMIRAKSHFQNIKRVVQSDMPTNGFDRKSCTLEPSFFSEKYGFQGRLDLLQTGETDASDRIIELKSGKAPFPSSDPTRIALNHETQTIIYRLMIQSVFKQDTRKIYPTILYSSVDNAGENLRWAAHYKKLEDEILNTRNLIVANEHDLYVGTTEEVEHLFSEMLDAGSYAGSKPPFFESKLNELKKVLQEATALERMYFYRFVSFVSRELYLQKAGDEGLYTTMSQSALWNKTFAERQDALELVTNLTITSIEEGDQDMIISFARNDDGVSSNFREGEICILYPKQDEADTMLTNQILKGTIMNISNTDLVLRFRYKQRNKTFFERYTNWTVEHDKLDHGYNSMFKCLFAFMGANKNIKELLLGLRKPQSACTLAIDTQLSIAEKQEAVLTKALAAEDYFLIVGPPGTGKTSVFARQLIERLYANQDTNILVMAYTNRAVDELCAAISSAFEVEESDCDKYIRIGSSLSCGEGYKHRLLQSISHKVKTRKELTDTIQSTRIFVGTLASISGKPELFSLKKFHTAIIDEASQILEPQIVGLLPLFDKFIMIGDHKQLSTITLQNEQHSKIVEPELLNIGLNDCRNSLFERLYEISKQHNWTTAYDTLTYHGRMHKDIARFVNENFYECTLREISERQIIPLAYGSVDATKPLQKLISEKRLAFFPTHKEYSDMSDKVNRAEAEQVVAIASELVQLYRMNDKAFDVNKTLGIITPYRNQIALIKSVIEESGIAELQGVMIDTVERYQGSQKDVIIVSFCMDRGYQLAYFSNMSKDGLVDRKLNVALTRAKEQLFLVGDGDVLSLNPIYKRLIDGL